MTQDELGRALGVKKAAVQKMESGKTSIGVDKLMLICETFNVMSAHILYGTFPLLWEKVYGVKVEGGVAPLNVSKRLAELDTLAERRFGQKGIALLRDMESLNETGVERAIAYVSDLMRIEDYRKSEEPSSQS